MNLLSRLKIRTKLASIVALATLTVIAIIAVLIGLCAVTIQLLLRVGSDAQARRSAAAGLGRLAEQFREDVHASDDAQLPPATGRVIVERPVLQPERERTAAEATRFRVRICRHRGE